MRHCIEGLGEYTDIPWPDVEHTCFTDGSSLVQNGAKRAGAAVLDLAPDSIVWAAALSLGTLAQKAKPRALTQALKLSEGAKVNIYTESRHAFATAYVHRPIFLERGLLTAEQKTIKNKAEILALPEALWLPLNVKRDY